MIDGLSIDVAHAAAHAVFGRCPGRWEAALVRANTGARMFWDKAIAAHPGATRVEAIDSDNAAWNGTIFAFTIATA